MVNLVGSGKIGFLKLKTSFDNIQTKNLATIDRNNLNGKSVMKIQTLRKICVCLEIRVELHEIFVNFKGD